MVIVSPLRRSVGKYIKEVIFTSSKHHPDINWSMGLSSPHPTLLFPSYSDSSNYSIVCVFLISFFRADFQVFAGSHVTAGSHVSSDSHITAGSHVAAGSHVIAGYYVTLWLPYYCWFSRLYWFSHHCWFVCYFWSWVCGLLVSLVYTTVPGLM